MNKATKQYRRKLRRALKCCRNDKRRFLEKFQKAWEPFWEETPNPTWQELIEAFGPPEEMARHFSESLTQEDYKRYRIRKWILIGALGAILAAVVVYAVSYMAVKPKIIYIEEELVIGEAVIVEDELADPIE